jgi:hypothetical protein
MECRGRYKKDRKCRKKKDINKEPDVKIRREIDKAERQKCFFSAFFFAANPNHSFDSVWRLNC